MESRLHGHSHDQSHHHRPHQGDALAFGRAFVIGIALNTAFVLVEVITGFLANSMALLADAGHNMTDVLGLLIALLAAFLAKRPATARFSFGLKSGTILAALVNSLLLLAACAAIAWGALQRFLVPEPVAGGLVMIVATLGIAINAFTAWLLSSGKDEDLNVRGAYLHMAADAAVSAAVVVTGLLISFTAWHWLDPLASLIIVAVILWSGLGVLRESIALSLYAVPESVNYVEVRNYLLALPGVVSVHDLHIWALSTTETAMSAHLVGPAGNSEFLSLISEAMEDRFGIGHVTIQIEQHRLPCCEATHSCN